MKRVGDSDLGRDRGERRGSVRGGHGVAAALWTSPQSVGGALRCRGTATPGNCMRATSIQGRGMQVAGAQEAPSATAPVSTALEFDVSIGARGDSRIARVRYPWPSVGASRLPPRAWPGTDPGSFSGDLRCARSQAGQGSVVAAFLQVHGLVDAAEKGREGEAEAASGQGRPTEHHGLNGRSPEGSVCARGAPGFTGTECGEWWVGRSPTAATTWISGSRPVPRETWRGSESRGTPNATRLDSGVVELCRFT